MSRRGKARIPTREKLVRALAAEHAPLEMIDRAAQGWYDDYTSPLSTPIAALVNDATYHGLNGIAKRAMAGEFDAQKWEADDWALSQGGQEALAQLAQLGMAMRRDGKIK